MLLDDFKKEILEKVTPKEKPGSDPSLNSAPVGDYRERLIENLQYVPHIENDPKASWKWEGPEDDDRLKSIVGEVKPNENQKKRLQETIGAVTATNAVPAIWSSEVSRGCRYPDSAFWEAPFVDWKKELYGN